MTTTTCPHCGVETLMDEKCYCTLTTPDEVLAAEWEQSQASPEFDDYARFGIDLELDAEGEPLTTSGSGLRLYRMVGGFSETRSKSKPIIKGLIDEASLTNITGPDGSGKSILALHAANNLAHGKVFLGQQLTSRTVLYIDQENKPANLQRLKEEFGWQEFSSTNPRSKFIHANMFSSLLTGAAQDELLIAKDKWQEQFPEKTGKAPTNELLVDWAKLHSPRPVIFIDTLARFFQGGDENSVQDFQHFWKQVNKLVEVGCAVVVLHHAQKNDAKKYRGSGDFKAKVDFHFAMENTSPDKSGKLTNFTIERLKQRSPEVEFSGKSHVKVVNGEFYFADARSGYPPILRELLADNPAINQTEFFELVKPHKIARDKALSFLKESSLVDETRGPNRQLIYTLKESR